MPVIVGILAAVLMLCTPGAAPAHDWYPHRCCSGLDCAPVRRIVRVPGGKWVVSVHGTVFVPSTFLPDPSQDNDAHVCMRRNGHGDMVLLCFFEPGIF